MLEQKNIFSSSFTACMSKYFARPSTFRITRQTKEVFKSDSLMCIIFIKERFITQDLLFSFRWGIGTKPEVDNVMAFRNFSHNTRHACVDIVLQHNTKYYSTLIVFNAALNSKDANSSSDGGNQPFSIKKINFLQNIAEQTLKSIVCKPLHFRLLSKLSLTIWETYFCFFVY